MLSISLTLPGDQEVRRATATIPYHFPKLGSPQQGSNLKPGSYRKLGDAASKYQLLITILLLGWVAEQEGGAGARLGKASMTSS